MNSCRAFAFSIVLFATVAAAASAQTVINMDWSFGAQTVSGDADVSTEGQLVDAFVLGEDLDTDPVVNGVDFFALAAPNGPFFPFGNYTFDSDSANFVNHTDLGSAAAPYGMLSPDYQTLLSHGISAANPTMISLTIGGLTVGQRYLFQFWTSNSSLASSAGGNRFNTTASGMQTSIALVDNMQNVDGGVGQFAIGYFTATDDTQTINFEGTNGSNDPMINAFQLRAVAAIPEPSSVSMLALGFLGTGFFTRRRRCTRA